MSLLTTIISLPITDPVLKFLIILIIILAAPLLLNKLRIPPLIGLIIAGAVIGPHGFNLVLRDSSIILSGTAGLLYIMFLAGLEIDLDDFKRNSWKSFVFGIFTFIIPMILGFLASYYIFKFSILSSILMASMFASHTLIAYPIISKLGISKDPSVSIAAGGTVITDTLALLVLTVVVGMHAGVVDNNFWIQLGVSIVVFGLAVILLYPIICRWFFKHVEDSVSQYIFVLVLLFLAAYGAKVAGMEAIIGAFLAGMVLNRLIPRTSALMNRIEFVGNAIFIPFFLIGVGMLINYRSFFSDWETIKVGVVMIITATLAKWLASWFTQKSFGLSVDQRNVIFGLSNAQAAATLAAVTVGHRVGLLNDAVINGTILMILVTCIIASFAAQKGASNIALSDMSGKDKDSDDGERVLISIHNPETVTALVELSVALHSKSKDTEMYVMNVIKNQGEDSGVVRQSKKMLDEAVKIASATDIALRDLLRYDISLTNAIISVVKEHNISDLIMGVPDSLASLTNPFARQKGSVLSIDNINTILYRPVQPLATIKRHLVLIPEGAEREIGFPLWIKKMWRLTLSTGAKMVFFASPATRSNLKDILQTQPIPHEFAELDDWNDFLIISRVVKADDCMWVVLSRRDMLSWSPGMNKIPAALLKYFDKTGFGLIYPAQKDAPEGSRYLI